MKATGVAAGLGLAISTAAATQSWAGANNYLLQGLENDVQQSLLQNLASSGAKVVRVWVNAQPGNSSCEKEVEVTQYAPDLETTIGVYNDETLALLDNALANIAAAGLKAIISPHDANELDGSNGDDIYGQTYGPIDFYTNSTAAEQYDARLSHIANYVSPSSGMAWKDWDVIAAFDIQNEPMSVDNYCSQGDPTGWMCTRFENFRSVLGDDNAIKITTGGIGGDYSQGCNFESFATNCSSVDIVAVHRYADNGWDEEGYVSSANNKLVFIEEWGISYATDNQTTEIPSNTETMNSQGLPWMYWEVMPPSVCSTQGSDTFSIYQGGDIDYATYFEAAANSSATQDWTGIIYS